MAHRVRRRGQHPTNSGVIVAENEADRLAIQPPARPSDIGSWGFDDDGRTSLLWDVEPADWRYLDFGPIDGETQFFFDLDGTNIQLEDRTAFAYINSITASTFLFLPENPVDGQEVEFSDISGAVGFPPTVSIAPAPGSGHVINTGFFILMTIPYLSSRLKFYAATSTWVILR